MEQNKTVSTLEQLNTDKRAELDAIPSREFVSRIISFENLGITWEQAVEYTKLRVESMTLDELRSGTIDTVQAMIDLTHQTAEQLKQLYESIER
jgi:hypothetical protein